MGIFGTFKSSSDNAADDIGISACLALSFNGIGNRPKKNVKYSDATRVGNERLVEELPCILSRVPGSVTGDEIEAFFKDSEGPSVNKIGSTRSVELHLRGFQQ